MCLRTGYFRRSSSSSKRLKRIRSGVGPSLFPKPQTRNHWQTRLSLTHTIPLSRPCQIHTSAESRAVSINYSWWWWIQRQGTHRTLHSKPKSCRSRKNSQHIDGRKPPSEYCRFMSFSASTHPNTGAEDQPPIADAVVHLSTLRFISSWRQ